MLSLVRLGRFHHIRQYFPVRGHSFLPNDWDFGCTELRKRKTERVFVPEGWHEVTKSSRRRNPFTVVPVTQSMVLGYSSHFSSFFKKTVQANKKPLNIQRAMVIKVSMQKKFRFSMRSRKMNHGANLRWKSVVLKFSLCLWFESVFHNSL